MRYSDLHKTNKSYITYLSYFTYFTYFTYYIYYTYYTYCYPIFLKDYKCRLKHILSSDNK